MSNPTPKPLAKPVSVKVRVDGATVAVVKTNKIGLKQAVFLIDELPLTVNSFVELEFFDGADRLIVPALVSSIGETELTIDYEQTRETFTHWLKAQMRRT